MTAILLCVAVAVTVTSFRATSNPFERLFKAQVDDVLKKLEVLRQQPHPDSLKLYFRDARMAYKRSSIFIDYYYPTFRRSINGPDLKYAEDDNPDQIHEPHGFQVIERIIYDENIDPHKQLSTEVDALIEIFTSIKEEPAIPYKLRNELIYDALKSSLIRLVTLGITGFDSPVALQSIDESNAVLTGMEEILHVYKDKDGMQLISNGKLNLAKTKNFDSFDRMAFIKEVADPLYAHLVALAITSGSVLPQERRPLNQFATSIFSDTLFNIHFFSPNERYRLNDDRVAIGKALFYDPIMSRAKRTCATCHQPSKGFADGLRVPVAINKKELKRNTPTLTAVAYQTKFFYDSRTATLETQLNSVVHNIDEMDGSMKEIAERIREHPQYHEQFKKAYPNDRNAVNEYNIANAISSYLRSMPVFNTRFDRYMRGEAKFTKQEIKGFNLFAGKAKCATCHFIPLFNGLVPPQFTETESEVLGVPSVQSPSKIDDDPGKIIFTRSEVNLHAFKTPTLRNVTKTAPYMHNGIFGTLEQVIEFYNKGGGAGLNIHLDNQSLPSDTLNLTKREMKSVIAFLGTLEN